MAYKQFSENIRYLISDSLKWQKENNPSAEYKISLIQKYQDGDESVINELLLCFYPVIAKLAMQYYNCAETIDDVFIESVTWSLVAFKSYKENLSSITTYLYQIIKMGLLQNLRKLSRHTDNEVSAIYINLSDKSEVNILETFQATGRCDDPAQIFLNQYLPITEIFVNNLSETDRFIFCSAYGLFGYL